MAIDVRVPLQPRNGARSAERAGLLRNGEHKGGVVARIVTGPHDANPQTEPSPADTIRRWSAEVGHPIQDLAEANLRTSSFPDRSCNRNTCRQRHSALVHE